MKSLKSRKVLAALIAVGIIGSSAGVYALSRPVDVPDNSVTHAVHEEPKKTVEEEPLEDTTEAVVETPEIKVETIESAPAPEPEVIQLTQDEVTQIAFNALQNDGRRMPAWAQSSHIAGTIAAHVNSMSLNPTKAEIEGYATKCVDHVLLRAGDTFAHGEVPLSFQKSPCWVY